MNVRLLVIILFLLSAAKANAQTTVEEQNVFLDQTIDYLKHLSVLSVEWTNNPEKTGYRQQMEDMIGSYDKIKENVSSVLILSGSETDRRDLGKLLDQYGSNRDALVGQLLLWKYEIRPIANIDLLIQLDEINEASRQILLHLQNGETDDAVSVLLSQEAAETTIVPLSDTVIEKLTTLKQK